MYSTFTDMKYCEAVKLVGQDLATNIIMPDLDLLSVLAAASIQSKQLERRSNNRVDGIPVFKME